jgi:hypothetical protein
MKPDCSCLAVAALLLSAAPAAQAIDVCAASDRALVATVLGGAVTKSVPGAPEADKATNSVGASCVFQRGNDALVITVTDFKGVADLSKHVTPASVLSDLGMDKGKLADEKIAGIDRAWYASDKEGQQAWVLVKGTRVVMTGSGGNPAKATQTKDPLKALAASLIGK